MLFFGRVLSIAPAKPVFLLSVGIFELGSLLCAIAPSVAVLIFGRAVAGLGASGLWVSIMSVIARVGLISLKYLTKLTPRRSPPWRKDLFSWVYLGLSLLWRPSWGH